MRLCRLRLTLGQLLMLVAVLAAAFALLRTPLGPAIVPIPPVLFCFAIERALGGRGVLGAMLGGLLTFVGVGVVFFAYASLSGISRVWSSPETYSELVALAVFGLLIGAVEGGLALLVLGYRDDQALPPEESIGPIVWRGLGDAGISYRRVGGPPP